MKRVKPLLITFIIVFSITIFLLLIRNKIIFAELSMSKTLVIKILSDITAWISGVIGLIWTYIQIFNLIDNKIHERFKTAINYFKDEEESVVYCGASLLHHVAHRSKDLRDNVTNLFMDKINDVPVTPQKTHFYKCATILLENGNLYKSSKNRRNRLYKTKFDKFPLEKVKLKNYDFDECSFSDINLSYSMFKHVNFFGREFINVTLNYVVFYRCDFINIDFVWENNWITKNAVFYKCNFNNVKFDRFISENIDFKYSFLYKVNFQDSHLTATSFQYCIATECFFIKTSLGEVKYDKAKITDCNFLKATAVEPINIKSAATLEGSLFKNEVEKLIPSNLLKEPFYQKDNIYIAKRTLIDVYYLKICKDRQVNHLRYLYHKFTNSFNFFSF